MGRVGEKVAATLVAGAENYSVAALAEVMTPKLVAEALSRTREEEAEQRRKEGRKPQAWRDRKVPRALTVWLLIGMALFRDVRIETVLRRVVDGVSGFVRFGLVEEPVATSVTQARDRLGRAMQHLFTLLARTLAKKYESASKWRDLVVLAIDGSCFAVPDTEANDAWFGRPGSSRGGRSAFPQMRAVLLIAAFTHLVVKAAAGPYSMGELTLANELLPMIPSGVLILMDRGYYAYAWMASLLARKSHFVVRAKSGKKSLQFKPVKKLGRDDRLVRIHVPDTLGRARPDLQAYLDLRIIKCRVKGFPRMLVATTLLDPEKYPAEEIVKLYLQRWEVELAYREIKVYQGTNAPVTFRSHKPARVIQEFFGLLIAYNCVRALMADAAQEVGLDPRELSFTDSLECIRATIPLFVVAGPEARARLLDRLRIALSHCRLPAKRGRRRCARAVKLKMSKWPRKRPSDATSGHSRTTNKGQGTAVAA
jgi:hypothetical protein